MLAAHLKRALVLHGDGTDLELLESEEIGRSDALVSVIDNDERNLFASLLGRQLGVPTRSSPGSAGPRICVCSSASASTWRSRPAAPRSRRSSIRCRAAAPSLLAVLEEGQATGSSRSRFRPASVRAR